MRIKGSPLTAILVLAVTVCLGVRIGFASPNENRSRSDKDINAIGRRDIGGDKGLGNWYSLAQEQELGRQLSAEIEKSSKVLDDPALTDYVTRIATNLAKNSDARISITVRLLDTDQVEAFTLLGGYQYISRGLLLRLDSEGELAGLLARGIAHTAVRSATRLMTRENFAQIASVPIILTAQTMPQNHTQSIAVPAAMLRFRRGFELEADYFGVQYLYKAGYSADGLVKLIERICPTYPASPKVFSPLPPTPDRVKALQKEIAELLPKRDKEIESTPEFDSFKERLQNWKEKPASTPSQN